MKLGRKTASTERRLSAAAELVHAPVQVSQQAVGFAGETVVFPLRVERGLAAKSAAADAGERGNDRGELLLPVFSGLAFVPGHRADRDEPLFRLGDRLFHSIDHAGKIGAQAVGFHQLRRPVEGVREPPGDVAAGFVHALGDLVGHGAELVARPAEPLGRFLIENPRRSAQGGLRRVELGALAEQLGERTGDLDGLGQPLLQEAHRAEEDADNRVAHALPEVGGGEHLEQGDGGSEHLDPVLTKRGNGSPERSPEEVKWSRETEPALY